MIHLQYYLKTGRVLNLKNPQRYTEKIQWYNLNYRDSLMTLCADKYAVRNYVISKGLEDILNPIYGVYDSADEIKFNELPSEFVLKTTNSSHTNIFSYQNIKFDKTLAIEKLNQWLKIQGGLTAREWAYYNIKPRIIAEKMIERDDNNDLPDYKFFCFNGEVKYLYTMVDYVDDHKNGKCSFFNNKFEKLPYRRSEFPPIDYPIKKPENFEKMVEIAEKLSKDFPHVRVDLYNIKGKIIFGELTFYNASGYTVYEPDNFDFILGNEFELKK